MRKSLTKKISIMAASCLAIACVSAGGATLAWADETVDPVLLMENGGAFYTVPGAAVKVYEGVTADGVDGNAMRFTFEMSEAQYASMIENGEYKNGASVSAYVIAEEKIDEGKTTASQIATDTDAVEAAIPASKWQSATSIVEGSSAKVYYACAYVYDLPDSSVYDKNVSAFAIATQTDSTTLYSSVQSRSMAYVADAALDSGKYVDKTTILEGYLPTYDVSFYAEDGVTVLGTTQARYGSAAVETDAVNEVLIGENVAAFPRYTATWHEKTGDAWAEDGNALSAYEVTGNTAYKMSLTDNGIMQAKMKQATVNGFDISSQVGEVLSAEYTAYNTVTAKSYGKCFYSFANTVSANEYSYKATVRADATYYSARDSQATYMPGVSIATSNADGSNAFAVTAKFAYWEKAGSVVLSISTLADIKNVVLYGSFADVYESRNADYSNWGDGALNATVEFVKTVDSIVLYVGGQKLCTMTADGVTLAAGVTSSKDATLTSDDYKNRIACFFGEGVESVCGIQGEDLNANLDFTYTVEQKEIDSSKNLMKYDEATDTVVYDGETPATSAQPQWYYLEGSGNSVYLDTTITTDGAAEVAQGTEGIIIKVGNKARRVLFANSGVYVFTEDDGKYDVNAGSGAAAYTNSGLTDSEGNYAIYQSLTTFGKYFNTDVTDATGNETPYGTWYGASRYSWGDISACNRVVYIIDGGYLYIALGADESSVSAFLKIDLNCMFNGLIDDSTVYKIGYASTGTRYWNNNAPRESGIVENPAYAYKTNELLFDVDAASKIAQTIANNFTERHAMMMNENGEIVNDGTVDGSSNYFYLAGSGKTVYLNTTITTDTYTYYDSTNKALVQATEGIIIRVGDVERRVLFAGTGVYIFTEQDGNLTNGTYTNSGLTDGEGNYAIYQSLATFGKYFDTNVKLQTAMETPYGTWYNESRLPSGYGALTADNCGNVTYVISDGYLHIALGSSVSDRSAFLKIDLKCMFGSDAIGEDTVYEIGYASSGNWYTGSNIISTTRSFTAQNYKYVTNEILYGDDATTAITEALALFA